ncbi:hypothetical protein EMPG_11860 [Blastomyces silverae]|uniref:Uncharacterized protein n=1 Tax=Blastomyces silverae TaxID=2060906 RepID=A0A0H1BVX2_9EURO|nr:hypothetical protein EMPG_11860 [Blastomyces silverae]
MASPEPNRPKLFARDIISYTDSELDQYLKDNSRIVTVQDPQNLTEEFIQRLRDYARRSSKEPRSQPVDLDQVAARLLQIPTNKNVPPVGGKDRDDDSDGLDEYDRVPTPPYDPEKAYQRSLLEQTGAYHALIKAGGRPSYPLSLLVDIVKDPGEYSEIFSFWQLPHERDNWTIFVEQLSRWKGFLRVQKFARGESVYDSWRRFWDDSRDSLNILDDRRIPDDEDEADRESYFDYLKENHGDDEVILAGNSHLGWDAYVGQDTPGTDGRFSTYANAIKERLTIHGFARTIELYEDLTRQDKLTTWAEYLAFEYYWYDYLAPSKAQQQFIDDAWKKLVESKALSPTDTQESLCSAESASERSNRLEQAEKAVESAKHAVIRAQKATSARRYPHKISAEEPPPDLLKAQQQLNVAEKEYTSIKKRNDHIVEFVRNTKHLRIKKRNADHHGKLVQWVLRQFPLIERELEQSKTTTDTAELSRHNNMPGDNRGDRATAKQNPTGKCSDTGEDTSTSDQIRTAPASQISDIRKRKHDITKEAARPSKRTRRSGRNQQLSGSARIDPGTAKNDDDVKAITPNKDGHPSRRGSSVPNPKTSALDPRNSSTVPNLPLRRSARIAQREQRLNAPISSSSEIAKPYPGTRKPRQAPADPINTKTQVSKRGTSKPQRTSKKKGQDSRS